MNDNSNPERTLELLAELEALGLSDRAFGIVHHHKEPERIASHRRYCEMLREEGAHFRTNGNRLVQRRLEMLLTMYKAGGLTRRTPEIFECLARVVLLEVPHDERPLAEQTSLSSSGKNGV